jgi:hypothetical protein
MKNAAERSVVEAEMWLFTKVLCLHVGTEEIAIRVARCHVRKRFTRNDQHNIHDIEGSLEVQRQLLLKLAERENAMMERPESGSTSPVESLESLKADTVQAIQKTWNQRSRFITKRRLLYT